MVFSRAVEQSDMFLIFLDANGLEHKGNRFPDGIRTYGLPDSEDRFTAEELSTAFGAFADGFQLEHQKISYDGVPADLVPRCDANLGTLLTNERRTRQMASSQEELVDAMVSRDTVCGALSLTMRQLYIQQYNLGRTENAKYV